MDEVFLSVGDVARILDLSTERVRALADEGRLPIAGRTRGGRVFNRSAVNALREERDEAKRVRSAGDER